MAATGVPLTSTVQLTLSSEAGTDRVPEKVAPTFTWGKVMVTFPFPSAVPLATSWDWPSGTAYPWGGVGAVVVVPVAGTVIDVSGCSRIPKTPRMAEAVGDRWIPFGWVVSTPNTTAA